MVSGGAIMNGTGPAPPGDLPNQPQCPIISLSSKTKPGSLMRIPASQRRGYNIEKLTVARTLDPTLSV